MNTENLIPISYVKKFTPLAVGDVINYSYGSVKHDINLELEGQVCEFNKTKDTDEYYSVVSFAPRTNTGKQPVDDDVVIDCVYDSKTGTDVANEFYFGNGDPEDSCLTTWKPNHAALLAKFKEQGANEMYTAENTAAATIVKIWNNDSTELDAPYIFKFLDCSGDTPMWLRNGKWEKFFTPIGEPNDNSVNFLHRPEHEQEAAHTDDNGEVTYALTYKLDTFTVLATHFSRVTDLHYRTMPGEFASVLVVTHIDEYDKKPTDWAWVVSDMTTNSELIHNIKGEFWSLNGTFANRSNEIATVDGERVKPLKAENKAVFTQEMADAGVAPKKGMLYRDGEIVKGADVDGMYVGEERGEWVIMSLESIKPIDNRTDEERIHDELTAIWDDGSAKWNIIDSIIASDKFTITLNKE